jgi:hypothetical protein
VGVVPFLVFDAVKLTAAAALSLTLGKRIGSMLRQDREGEKQ